VVEAENGPPIAVLQRAELRDISEARAHGPAMKKALLVVVLILGVAGD
jgi:hypothetical protein